jgi:hypothetical protein
MLRTSIPQGLSLEDTQSKGEAGIRRSYSSRKLETKQAPPSYEVWHPSLVKESGSNRESYRYRADASKGVDEYPDPTFPALEAMP